MKNNNISIVHAFQKREQKEKRKSSVMAWFCVLIGWRARGGVASHSRRTPSENEICEVIWGSISCFHQCGGPHFKCFCVVFLFPLSGCEMNAAEKGVKHTIFSIFSSLLAALLPDAQLWGFQQRDIKEKSKDSLHLCIHSNCICHLMDGSSALGVGGKPPHLLLPK